jgi:integrase
MQKEVLPAGKIDFYTPGELRKILDASEGALRVVTALQAFGGARLEEALRLRYEDLHRTLGHIEISGLHAKTRKRRLLEVGSALGQWLAPFKDKTGAIWDSPLNSFITEWARLRESVGVPSKRNGLRHGFVSFSYILRGEIETSALAGTSPQILHQNYRGLATKAEAEKWFATIPPKAAKNVIPFPSRRVNAR